MGKIIELERKKLDGDKLHSLRLEMSKLIGDAEMMETEDGDIVMDITSEMKCEAIEKKITMEYLKAGYGMEELGR